MRTTDAAERGAPRVLMLDVDGVVVVSLPGGWAATLDADLGLPKDVLVDRFFRPHWDDVVRGRATLDERLAPVLAAHAPHLTVDRLAAYWFENDARVDVAVLEDVARLRADGLPVHLATVQEHRRAAYLWTTLGFRERFDGLHYAAELGSAKPEMAFFRRIAERVGGAELLLVDDRQDNVDGARDAGWRAALWDGTRRLGDVVRDAWPA